MPLPYLFVRINRKSPNSASKSTWYLEYSQIKECFIYHVKLNDHFAHLNMGLFDKDHSMTEILNVI